MREYSSWSLSLHRWWDVRLRLHAAFLLFSVVMLYLAARDPAIGGYGFLGLAILLVSVLAHEIGHCAAVFRLGGSADQIVIGPWSGLTQPQPSHDPQQELFAALAGPAVNLTIWLITGPLVYLAGGSLFGLLNPFHPAGLYEGSLWAVGIKLTFWINWVILLINLAPAYPMDGVRAYRALLCTVTEYHQAIKIVGFAAQILAMVLIAAAWLTRETGDALSIPTWVPLLLAAIYLYFSGKHELARLDEENVDDDLFSYDFSQGYTSLERHFEGPRRKTGKLRSWIDRRRDERRQRQADLERDEERQVDEILIRLHEVGRNGLTAQERALLNRVSARLRNRQRS